MRAILLFVLLSGCAAKPTAEAVCKQLETSGIGTKCREEKPEAISGRAKSKWVLDLASVPGKTGQVLSFADGDAYQATANAFEQAGMLAGTHRYGNQKALIFVQLNSGASLEVGKKTKGIVDGL